ncbi:MAG TPA: PqqD family protein [Solirubrobacteraceae bacterium]|nr:PqqD family protein [Solirubrobacteraceae bacterium]
MTEGRLRLRAERLEWRAVGDEVVALDLADSTYLAVGAVGAAMWPKLADGTDLDELVGVVVERFEVDEPTARRDIAAFVDELAERDLLER